MGAWGHISGSQCEAAAAKVWALRISGAGLEWTGEETTGLVNAAQDTHNEGSVEEEGEADGRHHTLHLHADAPDIVAFLAGVVELRELRDTHVGNTANIGHYVGFT